MKTENSLQKKNRILCPECSNYIDGKLPEDKANKNNKSFCLKIKYSFIWQN